MQQNFAAALALVLRNEGGFVNDPRDAGGATNMGITRRTLAAWRGVAPWQSLPASSVKNLSETEASAIYRAEYWAAIDGDNLPSGVDLVVFDYAVNSGVSRAAITLQEIVGVAADGKIGPLTIAAVNKASPNTKYVITKLCAMRLRFLQQLSGWPHFGAGWHTRVNTVEAAALKLAS